MAKKSAKKPGDEDNGAEGDPTVSEQLENANKHVGKRDTGYTQYSCSYACVCEDTFFSSNFVLFHSVSFSFVSFNLF